MKSGTLIFISLLLLFAACTEKPAEKGATGITAPVKPSMDAKCPVCGMMPAKYPEWQAQVVLKNGERYHFDSPRDMFRFVLGLNSKNEPRKWIDSSEIAALFVTDYSTAQYIDATRAYYVKDSEVRGPMGRDLVPFAKKEEASNFASQHGGEVLAYKEVTVEVIKTLGTMKMEGPAMPGMQMDEGEMKM